jgi:NAD(P)H-hydrate epimerase
MRSHLEKDVALQVLLKDVDPQQENVIENDRYQEKDAQEKDQEPHQENDSDHHRAQDLEIDQLVTNLMAQKSIHQEWPKYQNKNKVEFFLKSYMYLNQKLAKQIDQILFKTFSLDQLMEIAGLSCFLAIQKEFKRSTCLVLTGPGNNGGDALVCARYLKHFGYNPVIWYPIRNSSKLFTDLVSQLQQLEIPFITEITHSNYDFVIDGIFGFGFHGQVKAPFDHALELVKSKAIVSIDVPSGWNVDSLENTGIQPKMLISLTGPKICSKSFKGIHYVGGRFVPPNLSKELGFEVVEYGSELVIKL